MLPVHTNNIFLINWQFISQPVEDERILAYLLLKLKILFLEIVSGVLFVFARKKEQADSIERCKKKRERLYPDVVNQLLILMEAGMTTRQAWHKIASQYTEKKKLKLNYMKC